jgi:hypothetical protein
VQPQVGDNLNKGQRVRIKLRNHRGGGPVQVCVWNTKLFCHSKLNPVAP